MERRLLGATALASVALALAGCGADRGVAQDPNARVTTLSILDYYNNQPDKTLVQAGLDTCATKLGVTLSREVVPGADLISKILQRASSDTLPDVMMVDNPEVKQIAAAGALAPLGDYGVTADGFAPGIVDATSLDGKLYGLAPVVNTIALMYNTEMLAEAGISPPTTWAELRDAAKKLTTPDHYGIAFSANATYEGSWQFLPAMWTNGGDETDLKSPQVAEALQLWTDLVNQGSASRSVLNWTQGDVKDQFVAGKAAMMLNGPWQFPALDKFPDLKWSVATFPVNRPGQTVTTPLGGEAWTVPITGKPASQRVAAQFVACLNSPEQQMEFARTRFAVPTRTDLLPQFAAEVPSMAAFTKQVATARARTGKLSTSWPKAATAMYTAIQLALTDQSTPAEAFRQADES
ncbi:extracellular solute-binding protein [Mycobacterium hodleri]|uniref:Extracellular solute-binding protein n=1 Tax=Mycolicibacterium hodleri TaxID=49897 RepID=A0A544VRJ8_9MYCO|nr:extracellular solute-binding protein [Mycolicibacterium hodleri]TQR82613.1 extracellular solute-binding protein [Mycolicibacterium hodleri]